MRRGLSGFLGVALAVSATLVAVGADVATAPPAAAAAPSPTPARTGVPGNIYAIGDSITTSTGTAALGDEHPANSWVTGTDPSSFPDGRGGSPNVVSMRHRLGIPQGSAVNLAHNGKRMQDFDDQANLLPASAQYVVVELGGNDLCRPSVAEMTSEASYRASFRAGLDAVASRAPNALIFVASIPDVYNLWYLRGHHDDQTSQSEKARIFWDNPTGFAIPCESLLQNPGTTGGADETRRLQVRSRNIAFNQILDEECGAVLRCRFDEHGLFNRSSNRLDPFNHSSAYLPRAQWWFEDRDISHDQGTWGFLCPANFSYSGCGDHFHPSHWGQAKLALSGHQLSYQFLTDNVPPTVTTTPSRVPDGNGVYARSVQVSFGGTDANGLRGQEVRIHQPDGSIGAWQPSVGLAPAVTVSATGTSYVEARSLDTNGNLSASTIRAITIDPSQFGGVGGTVSGPSGPLSGIQVTLHASGAQGALRTTTTAADGTYAFTDVLASADVKVLADDLSGVHVDEWYDNAASHTAATAIDVPGNGASVTRNLTLALTPGTVAGTVTGPSGGLSGIQVDLHATGSPGVVASTTTGAGGAYSLTVVPGSYKAQFVDPAGDHLGEWFDDRSSHGAATAVTVTRNTTTTANALLGLTPGALGGTVSDSGGPLTGITVDLHLAGASGVVATTTTDGAGHYSFPLVTPGAYRVHFTDPTGVHLGEWHADAASHAAATSVNVVKNVTADVDAVLARTPGGLGGTVSGPSGGLTGIRVDLHASGSPGVLASTTTGASGAYSFPTVLPGSYKVQFVDPAGDHLGEWFDDRTSHGTATVVGVTPSTSTTVNALLSRTPGGLGGTVSDSLGPLQGITVDLHSAAAPGVIDTATTNGVGQYSFPTVPPGSYRVQFTDPSGDHLGEWHANAASHAAATSVAVVENGTTDVDAVLARTPGAIGGTVTEGVGGVAGIRVDLHAAAIQGVVASTTTGAAGTYSFPTVVPGSYKIEFTDPSGVHAGEWHSNAGSHASANAVTVVKNATTTVSAVLSLVPGSIRGTVTGPDGPLEDIEVAVLPSGPTTTTDADGTYELSGLAPGPYTVATTAVPCTWLSDDASAVVPTAGGADEGVDLVVAEEEPGPHGLTGVPTWVEAAVRWLIDDCNDPPYMTGLPDGSFGATDDISRGQVLRAIWRIEGQPAESTPHGLDGVPLWIEPAVRWAVHHEYMTGFRDGTFRADAPISRAQIARLLYRLADSPTPNDPHGLSDVPVWVEQAVRWMVAEGHASGIGGAFLPERSTRRAEFASWAFRIYG